MWILLTTFDATRADSSLSGKVAFSYSISLQMENDKKRTHKKVFPFKKFLRKWFETQRRHSYIPSIATSLTSCWQTPIFPARNCRLARWVCSRQTPWHLLLDRPAGPARQLAQSEGKDRRKRAERAKKSSKHPAKKEMKSHTEHRPDPKSLKDCRTALHYLHSTVEMATV